MESGIELAHSKQLLHQVQQSYCSASSAWLLGPMHRELVKVANGTTLWEFHARVTAGIFLPGVTQEGSLMVPSGLEHLKILDSN